MKGRGDVCASFMHPTSPRDGLPTVRTHGASQLETHNLSQVIMAMSSHPQASATEDRPPRVHQHAAALGGARCRGTFSAGRCRDEGEPCARVGVGIGREIRGQGDGDHATSLQGGEIPSYSQHGVVRSVGLHLRYEYAGNGSFLVEMWLVLRLRHRR